jgi:hypothetical protein
MAEAVAALSLFPATLEQVWQSRNRTFVEWGRGRTLEAYLERDRILDRFEHAADGKLITWVLAPRDDPTTLDFKCSCETYTRTGIVAMDGNPSVQEVTCYGIASVFTPAEYRKRGYAGHMMSLLHWVLAKEDFLSPADFPEHWGSPPKRVPAAGQGYFSTLWSDVGPNYYRKSGPLPGVEGWVVRSPMSTHWDIATLTKTPSSAQSSSLSWTWLNETQCSELLERDGTRLKQELGEKLGSTDSSAIVSFLPGKGVAAFQRLRMAFFMGNSAPVGLPWGVAEESDQPERTFATFSMDVGVPVRTLLVSRLRATPQTFPALFSKLLEAAAKCDAEVLEIWSLDEDLTAAASALGAKTRARDEHLPAIKSYCANNEKTDWAYVEKFCWC